MRVGLIGGGNISETHARAAKAIPGVEIAAVFGVNQEKVRRLSEEYGGTPYFGFEEFLAHQPMDFVAIGSPSGLHAEQGAAAARRGLHIICEKPLDITIARADALIKWFRPAEYYADSRWRGTLRLDGGCALINQAIHTADLLLWLFGDVV